MWFQITALVVVVTVVAIRVLFAAYDGPTKPH